jgi:hypothetical protein
MKAKQLWSLWQALLGPFAWCFTRPGFARFVQGLTGLALNTEEHTVTQSLIALDQPDDWKALEAFVEYGAWHHDRLVLTTAQAIEDAPGRLWYSFHVWAGDDTKVHRSSQNVWGTCTFHEPSARCPNRATTVRAHNWVCLGALLHNPNRPAWYLPVSGQLYFRKSQLPGPGSNGEPPVVFRTKCQLLVQQAQHVARAVPGKHLLVADGAYAVRTVIVPLVTPPAEGQPRVEVISRLRVNARLYRVPDAARPKGKRGPKPKWGAKLPPPRQGGRWPGPWQQGKAFLYGRLREVQWKEVLCLWRPLGPGVVIKAVVAKVAGYKKRFTLMTTATELSGLQVVELFAARFRQEDGIRDLKQRLGWEECRAWTRQPIEVTTHTLFVALTLLRLLQLELESRGEEGWWYRPPWDRKKDRPSVLDLGRLLRRHAREIQQLLSSWLGKEGELAGAAAKVCDG